MLRKLKVRTRLVAVVAALLALLLAMTVPEALARRAEAAETARLAEADGAVANVNVLIDALQDERTLSAGLRTGGGAELQADVRDQRTVTDGALGRVTTSLRTLTVIDRRVAAAGEQVVAQVARLGGARAETDAAESIETWTDPFEPILSALLDLQDAVAAAGEPSATSTRLARMSLVGRLKDAAAAQDAHMAAVTSWGDLPGDEGSILGELRDQERGYETAYLAATMSDQRSQARSAIATDAVSSARSTVDRLIDGGVGGGVDGGKVGTLADWLELSSGRQDVLGDVRASAASGASRAAHQTADAAGRAARTYLALLSGVVTFIVLVAAAVVWSITRPLHSLLGAVEREAAIVDPSVGRSRDELARLSASIRAMHAGAADAAARQASQLRKDVSELYVNLARRNQTLIDRQISLLDGLESDEQDPEVLQHLYQLDHLATRMRRNAESLLVLAGSKTVSRRENPVGMVDVVRAAISEIEDYQRVELGTMSPSMLVGHAVSDVAHLVAELLENATQFSPPGTDVRVAGEHSGGTYRLTISDHGMGIAVGQLAELNALLRDPPATGLGIGRTLGCLVAARLAARHGITVRLQGREGGGVIAFVVVPASLLAGDVGAISLPASSTAAAAEVAPEEEVAPDGVASDGVAEPAPRPARPMAGPPGLPPHLRDAVPAQAAFEADLKALLDREPAPDPLDRVQLAPMAVPVPEMASLPHRTPGATTETHAEMPVEPAQPRSPAEVRRLLSKYRSGLVAGRLAAGAHEGERS